MSSCWVNVQVMSSTGKSSDPEERAVVSSCACVFSSWTSSWMLLLKCRGHFLVCSGIQKRAVSLANKRVLMQGFHVVFLEKNVLPNKYHLVLSVCQGFDDGLRARRTALPWTVSSRALEADSSRMIGGWLFLAKLSPDNWGGWLLLDGLVVLYSFFLNIQKGAISENSWNRQPVPSNLHTETLACSLLLCSAHSWWFSVDIFPRWPC